MFDTYAATLQGAGFAVAATTVAATFPSVPTELVMLGISIAGSGAAVGFRFLAGDVPDRASRLMAFLSGILFAYVAVPWVNKVLDLDGLDAGVFVLLLSLIGARVVKFLSTDFDVAKFVDGLLSRLSRK
ncbi:MAG: hypothetical protein AAF926_06960 [Pseudomonadota bacterium]